MMRTNPSMAVRLDHAVGELVAGVPAAISAATAGLDRDARALVDIAERLRLALGPPPVAPRFEARLGARLAGLAPETAVPWARRRPSRLLVTGAVGSAVGVGVGVTAYAVWRTARRGTAHRFPYR
jgi:hypothetical protein